MTDLRVLWMLLATALTGALLYVLAPVLTPFLIAALLAYVFNPLVTHLDGWRVPAHLRARAGQALDGMLLTPNLVGDRIGLHPVAVIFAVLAGGQLFGFFGVLLALPVAAVILVWLRPLHGALVVPPKKARRRS